MWKLADGELIQSQPFQIGDQYYINRAGLNVPVYTQEVFDRSKLYGENFRYWNNDIVLDKKIFEKGIHYYVESVLEGSNTPIQIPVFPENLFSKVQLMLCTNNYKNKYLLPRSARVTFEDKEYFWIQNDDKKVKISAFGIFEKIYRFENGNVVSDQIKIISLNKSDYYALLAEGIVKVYTQQQYDHCLTKLKSNEQLTRKYVKFVFWNNKPVPAADFQQINQDGKYFYITRAEDGCKIPVCSLSRFARQFKLMYPDTKNFVPYNVDVILNDENEYIATDANGVKAQVFSYAALRSQENGKQILKKVNQEHASASPQEDGEGFQYWNKKFVADDKKIFPDGDHYYVLDTIDANKQIKIPVFPAKQFENVQLFSYENGDKSKKSIPRDAYVMFEDRKYFCFKNDGSKIRIYAFGLERKYRFQDGSFVPANLERTSRKKSNYVCVEGKEVKVYTQKQYEDYFRKLEKKKADKSTKDFNENFNENVAQLFTEHQITALMDQDEPAEKMEAEAEGENNENSNEEIDLFLNLGYFDEEPNQSADSFSIAPHSTLFSPPWSPRTTEAEANNEPPLKRARYGSSDDEG